MKKGIGARLRDAREQNGLDLDEVYERTKIRPRYLEALEEERWDLLPAPVYTRGFLRTYARVLGLDAESLVADYRSIHSAEEPEPVPQLSDEQMKRGAGARLLAGLSSLRGPWRRPDRSRQSGSAARRPSLAVVLALGLVALLVIGVITAGDDDGDDRPTAEAPQEEVENAEEEPEETEVPEEEPRRPRIQLELVAVGDVWVCLVDRRGRPLVDGEILAAGEERGPFRGRAFEAGLGNGQVEITSDGEAVDIAESPDPVGYRITAGRARELEEGRRPTCA